MKFLYWCVGVLQILTGFMLAWSVAPAWHWVWISVAIFWLFAGVSAGVVSLAKLVAGKVGAGGRARALWTASKPPTPDKEE